MKTIIVKIITKQGERHQYTGLFSCPIDAIIDAASRFDIGRIVACVA